MPTEHGGHGPGAAFLLSQIGAAAAMRFADKIAELDLSPPLAGLLRQLAAGEPQSQQDLARQLGTAPSRVVGYLDELESRGAVRRQPGPDRRVNLVSLTAEGQALLRRLGKVARAHDESVTAALDPADRETLLRLLRHLAGSLDLTPGVHPGYRVQPAKR